MNKTIYSLCLLIFLAACNNANTKKTESQENIQTTLTEKHVNIPGSRLYVIPPPGYIVSIKSGIIKVVNDTVVAYINGGDSIGQSFKAIHKEELDKQSSVNPETFFNYKINGLDAIAYCNTNTFVAYNDCGIAFGDITFTAYANYWAVDTNELLILREALKTIYYDKTKNITPFDKEEYSVDDSKSRYKLANSIGESFIFTIGGEKKNYYTERDNAFIVMQVTENLPPINDVQANASVLYKQKGATNIKVGKIESEDMHIMRMISQFSASFTNAEGMECVQYMAYVSSGNIQVMCVGTAHDDHENNLQEFKNLARTIEFK